MAFLTELALSRKPVTIMVMLLVLAGGIYGYNRLQQELFPDISFGSIIVWTGYAQGDPITVANEVTEEVEDAIIGMADLDRVTSISTSSISLVTANFVTGSDMDSAEDEITSRVSGLNLPDDAGTPLRRADYHRHFPRDALQRNRRPRYSIIAPHHRRPDCASHRGHRRRL